MPLTLDATPGGASANTYCTEAQADTLAEAVSPATVVDAWATADPDDRKRALVTATAKLDQLFRFRGVRATETQALEWPRDDADTLPAAIVQATARLAYFLVSRTDDPFTPGEESGLASISYGSELSMSFEPGATSRSPGDHFMAGVIRPLLAGVSYAPGAHVVRG